MTRRVVKSARAGSFAAGSVIVQPFRRGVMPLTGKSLRAGGCAGEGKSAL
ncbi:MAG: hypothetical protein M3178_02415 [Pseudomonadota bacterium]|nr:hypothetical protein [Pseudomonadota bacterium]